ncbi:MAG: hypothetical protein P1P84_02120 [Deferrisomatales bacterium]|nr:hypothetical protein [Deferrisomatales bacterium]
MHGLLYFEGGALAALVTLALFRPGFAAPIRRRVSRWVGRLARRKALAAAAVGLLALGISAGLSSVRWPVPRVQDEFSYLLAADTFAHGRLTNPTPPLAEHFESRHILVEPTYQSKYPPAQGLFLAFGQVLTGSPLVGVWISWALACAALTWMLQAWVPPRWALLGGVVALTHFGVFDDWYRGRFLYWSLSYWGGAVPMLGGGLVFGALRRLVREAKPRHAAVLAVGLGVLAASRPYEGLVASLPVAAVFAWWLARGGREGDAARRWRVVFPIAAVLAVAGAGLGYYNYRVTGDPLLMPHAAHESASGMGSHFVLPRIFPESPDPETEAEPSEAVDEGGARRWRWWLTREYERRFERLWSFYLGPLFTMALLALPWAWRDRWARFGLLTCGALIVANLATLAGFPHYYAPVAPLVVALAVTGLRRLRLWRFRGRPVGRAMAAGMPAVALATFAGALALHLYYSLAPVYPKIWSEYRAETIERLEAAGGKHLIVVRPPPEHRGRNDEWVYNGADFEAQTVLWAREMDPASNARLLARFPDRKAWSLKANTRRVRFTPWEKR